MSEETLLASLRADISQFRSEMQEAVRVIQRMGEQTQQSNKKMEASFASLSGAVKTFGGSMQLAQQAAQTFGLSLSVLGLAKLAQEAIQASTTLATLTTAFKTITGSAQAAAAELGFVRELAQRLGLNFVTLAQGFQHLSAAAKGTVLEGQGIRTVFTSVSEAARVMGLGTEQTGRLMVGLTQIMGKGVVQMEEWRQQIGEALPQATTVMAQALGVSTRRLFEMIEAGQVGLPELLRFAETLRSNVAGGVDEASRSFLAATGRMGNAWRELFEAIGTTITQSPAVVQAIEQTALAITELAKTIRENQATFEAFITFFARAGAAAAQGSQDILRAAGRTKDMRELEILSQAIQTQSQAVDALRAKAQAGGLMAVEGGLDKLLGFGSFTEQAERENAKLLALQQQRTQIMNRLASGPDPEGLAEAQEAAAALKVLQKMREDGVASEAESLSKLAALRDKYGTTEKEEIARINRELQLETQARARAHAEAEKAANARQATLRLLFEEEQSGLKASAESYVKLTRDVSAYDALLQSMQERLPAHLAQLKQAGATDVEILQERIKYQKDFAKLDEEIRQKSYDFTVQKGRQDRQLIDDQIKANQERAKAILTAEDKAHQATQARLADELKLRATSLETSAELQEASTQYVQHLMADTEAQVQLYEEAYARGELTDAEFQAKRMATEEAYGDTVRDTELGVARLREREADKALKDAQRALDKQAREWERFAERVSDTISDTIFDVLTGRIEGVEDLFDRMKDAFLRTISDMAAQALTHQIIMPIVMQVMGGAGGQGGAMGALGTGQQALGMFGGAAGQFNWASWAQGNPGTMQGPTPTGEPLGGSTAAGMGGSLMGVAGGAALGMSTGFLLQSFNTDVLGMPRDNSAAGRGSRALAGMGGGAMGGAIAGSVFGPLGTAVGAVAGAIIGGLVGGLTKVATVPFLQFKAVDLMVGMQDEALTLVENNIVAAGKGLPGSMVQVADTMEQGLASSFKPIFDTINSLSPRIREGMLEPMNRFADDLEELLEGPSYQVAKKQGKEFVEKFLAEEIPRLMSETFGPLIQALEKVQPLIEGYRSAIATLQQQQERLLGSLSAQKVALQEALMTPAQLFERRRSELGGLLGRFRGAGGAEQLRLVPEIQALIGEVMQRGQAAEVMGTDRQALVGLQKELIGYVDELTAVSTQVLDTQMSQAQHQIDVLEDSLLHLASVDATAAASRLLLQDLTNFLATAFQGGFQSGGMIPHTGFALVHRGELILPAGPISINLTVNSSAPHNAGMTADIERTVVDRILPMIRQRQRLGQF